MSGCLHELPDQLSIMRGLTKWGRPASMRRAEAPGLINEAFRACCPGRRPSGRTGMRQWNTWCAQGGRVELIGTGGRGPIPARSTKTPSENVPPSFWAARSIR